MTIALARTRIKNMNNSQLQLKDLSEKNAKAIATSVTKFLASQGINLQHTKALDLAGTLCGFGDWQGLQAAIVRKEADEAATPIKMSYEDFIEKFKPIKNTLCDHANADGYAFALKGAEYEAVLAAYERNPGTVWTCTEGDASMWIGEGLHSVNRQFYLITKKPAQAGRFYEIPYGHDEGDLCFEVSVMNPETRESEVIDTMYESSADAVLDRIDIDLNEEFEGVVDAGQSRVIIVKQVPA
jgi:hypothetical protein